MSNKMIITEEMQEMAIIKGIPESEFSNIDCLKYLKTCIDSKKPQKPQFFDDRAEVNDDQTYYSDMGD